MSSLARCPSFFLFFFFHDTAPSEIYTLSLHDALPILRRLRARGGRRLAGYARGDPPEGGAAVARRRLRRIPLSRGGLERDRKSTRLNSSHTVISYAVFCLKKKKTKKNIERYEND